MTRRAGRVRRKPVENVNYHGIVVYGMNINDIFSNYAVNKKFRDPGDPLLRSAIIKGITYVINKRKNQINRNKLELNSIDPSNKVLIRSRKRSLNIHKSMLNSYQQLLNRYKNITKPVINSRMFNIEKKRYEKYINNKTGLYKYRAIN